MNAHLEKYGSLTARLAVAAIFIHAGWTKLAAVDATAAVIAAKGLPASQLGAWLTVLLELGGGLAIAAGLGTRPAAFAIALFLAPATWFFHNPMGLEPAAAHAQWIHVYKNLAIAGGERSTTSGLPHSWPLTTSRRGRRQRSWPAASDSTSSTPALCGMRDGSKHSGI